MSPTQIRRTARPMASTEVEYLRYFSQLADEHTARAQRLETRLIAGKTATGSPDFNVDKPSWELDDVCCYTSVSLAELQTVLPDLFDGYRRYARALRAATAALHVRRRDRLATAARGLDALLDDYLAETTVDESTERLIDRWLENMVGPCTWSTHDHHGYVCQKPVPWTKADVGGGRSTVPVGTDTPSHIHRDA